ncbi:DUF3095 family protein [Lyngbya aestuarii]|uniref:DUF3095 family protein n=1 Tax=Lyngbya aestuarii TaxID=118322 RepID=UPI00403D6AC6
MSTEYFYADLPILDNFLDVTDPTNFHAVPSDWYIVITDIIGSTKAIESGLYKDVNLLGACSIAAVLNIAGNLEIPFVFGGDGASILIPPSLFAKTRQALLGTSQRARKEFNLDLRVGAVPVSDIIETNHEVKVAKFKVSEQYYQAAFAGGGVNYATELIKNPESAHLYSYGIAADGVQANFSGLECRWQEIPTKNGESVSLIVSATTGNREKDSNIYRAVILLIKSIYGSEDYFKPIAKEHLKLAFSYKYLKSETRLRAKSGSFLHKLLYFCKIWIENLLGWFLMTFEVKLPDGDWKIYKKMVVATTDYQKFDDTLRMIIDGNFVQTKKLTRFLERSYQEGKLVYGLHTSDRTLITCLIFERHGRQVHFVDGADGGYAAAAKELKQRIKSKQVNY